MFVGRDRRHFLTTSAGLLVSIPFLPSMVRAVGDPPRRLKFVPVRSQQGTYKNLFRPDVSRLAATPVGGETSSYDITQLPGSLSTVFGAEFDGLKSKINFYKGFDPMLTWFGHNHSLFLAAFNRATGSSPDTSYTETPPGQEDLFPPKPTIDHLISNQAFSTSYDVHNVVLTVYEETVESYSFSYNKSGTRIVRQIGGYDPQTSFNKFFGGATTDGVTANQTANRRKLVVDQVLGSYKSFAAKRSLSSEDQVSLSEHMEFLHSVETRLNSSLFQNRQNPGIVIDPRLDGRATSQQCLYTPELVEPTYKIVMDIAVAAMRCDAIRVFSLCMYDQDTVATKGNGPHDMHHMAATEANKPEAARLIDSWYGKMLGYLVNQMDAVDEPEGGTMLDNSLVLYNKEMSDEGPNHTNTDLLLASLGSLGGKIKTGQFLDYERRIAQPNQPHGDNRQGRSYNQFLTSIMHGGFGMDPSLFETNGDFGERGETVWRNSPFVEKNVLVPGMFV